MNGDYTSCMVGGPLERDRSATQTFGSWPGGIGYDQEEMERGEVHLCIRRPYVTGLSRVLLPTDNRSIVLGLNIRHDPQLGIKHAA